MKPKTGDMVNLAPPHDILGAEARTKKSEERAQPRAVFDLKPGVLSRADCERMDRAQIAAFGGLLWKTP